MMWEELKAKKVTEIHEVVSYYIARGGTKGRSVCIQDPRPASSWIYMETI